MRTGNMSFDDTARRIISGRELSGGELDSFVEAVAAARGGQVLDLIGAAGRLRDARLGRSVSLCAIVNAKSGLCSEDCAFCAQSARRSANAPVHPFLDVEDILGAAKAMRQAGARRFGIVTSGLALSGEDFERLVEAVRAVSGTGMLADASCGLMSAGQLKRLRDAGLCAYHHNLETSRSFFPRICTTHDYEDDVATVRDAVALGLNVCSGGIFGLGESWPQRAELALTLRELAVPSVPVNFLTPIPGTPMQSRPVMEADEALKTVALLRFILPSAQLRVCGGRGAVFGQDGGLWPLEAGATGFMIGDYLTTKGLDASRDVEALTAAGWRIADD
jgi:biotin synthase